MFNSLHFDESWSDWSGCGGNGTFNIEGGGEGVELHWITLGWNLPVSSMDGENCHRGLGVYQSLSIERIQRIHPLLRASISPHIPTL